MIGRDVIAAYLLERLYETPAVPIAGLEFSLAYRFATESAGGDVADVFECSPGTACVTLTDIAGCGLKAATSAALIKFGIRAYAQESSAPAFVASKLNELYMQTAGHEDPETFATMFFGTFDIERRTLTYTSAGHEPSFLIHRNGFVEVLPPTAPLIGVLSDALARFEQRTIDLPAASTLVIASDGVTDARRRGRQFGLQGVRRSAAQSACQSVAALVSNLIDAAAGFADGLPHDDIAVIAARFREA